MTEQPAHPPLRTIADVMAIVCETAAAVVDAERQLVDRMADTRPNGFPTNSSSEGAGGPTNRVFNFGTDDDPDLELVPQHSDPTGEQVVRDPLAGDDGRVLRNAYREALRAMRSLEACHSHLRATQRRDKQAGEPDRNNCWPCLEVGVRSEVYRDSSPSGKGRHQPRCRRHYDFFLAEGRDAPPDVAVWWAEGRRVSQQMIDQALGETARGRGRKNRKRKKR